MNESKGRIFLIWILDFFVLLCVAHSAVGSIGEEQRLERPLHFCFWPQLGSYMGVGIQLAGPSRSLPSFLSNELPSAPKAPFLTLVTGIAFRYRLCHQSHLPLDSSLGVNPARCAQLRQRLIAAKSACDVARLGAALLSSLPFEGNLCFRGRSVLRLASGTSCDN